MEVDLHYVGYAITHYFKHAFIWIAKWVNPENLTWCLFSLYLLRQTPKVRINTGREPQAFTHSYKQWTQHKLWFPADTGKKAAANVSPHLHPEWLYEKRLTFLLTNLAPSKSMKEGKLQNRCNQAESHGTPAIYFLIPNPIILATNTATSKILKLTQNNEVVFHAITVLPWKLFIPRPRDIPADE